MRLGEELADEHHFGLRTEMQVGSKRMHPDAHAPLRKNSINSLKVQYKAKVVGLV